MKFNIFFTITGPTGDEVECPNTTNPVECTNLSECMRVLVDNIPHNESLGVECVGVRIQKVED